MTLYHILKFTEKVTSFVSSRMKLTYYKLKYGQNLKIGKGLRFRKRFQINMSKSGRLHIGANCFFNNDCSINIHGNMKIGDRNLFGEGVKIYDHNHIFYNKNLDRKQHFKNRNIVIGDDNWIGSDVVILSKTSIGNNNVIGANVVLNEEIDSGKMITAKEGYTSQDIVFKD